MSKNRKGIAGTIGEGVWCSKLNPWKVRVIKQLLKFNNLYQREIAEVFNVDRKTIGDINTGKTWKHI